MKNNKLAILIQLVIILFGFADISAQNPIIRNQFSADPTARVFGDKIYLYPSHDILGKEGQGRPEWFCMEDYHVFSSSNLTDWTDHGVILNQTKVKWADSTAFSMWAPDCISKNGKYYFYFPAPPKGAKGFSVGVAVANNPFGPFIPQPKQIDKVSGIDPNVFIDKDGQAYLYWSAGNFMVAKLKSNMVELASEPQIIANLPEKGLKEGPFLFERKGVYYLTFPHVENKIERLEYAMGPSPMGPFKMAGVIMDESPVGCWTNHHSIINFKKQWYLFYHSNDLSPKFDKNRSVRIDSLFFNADGTIRKVTPTFRGVGLTDASKQIQIDRYSRISDKGVSVSFIDTLNTFAGWKTVFNEKNAWVQYNKVDFGKKKYKSVIIKAISQKGGILQLKLNSANGPILAKINLPESKEWKETKVLISGLKQGSHNLFLSSENSNIVEVDWIKFE
ncbi:Carbohydrate binding module (family 6) [Bacteroides luti]|uniref:Carbohydrate binding module (Family 6) n=1 Tax=Bacteroides luti TaxID=1297750 RepID=A0A1M5DV60_9BACE|nr:family 43 glycosylhydrolase [Bacteroides luti]SHF70721.1 Carbohydrate binding module (family 6) [Bacteroides luti]